MLCIQLGCLKHLWKKLSILALGYSETYFGVLRDLKCAPPHLFCWRFLHWLSQTRTKNWTQEFMEDYEKRLQAQHNSSIPFLEEISWQWWVEAIHKSVNSLKPLTNGGNFRIKRTHNFGPSILSSKNCPLIGTRCHKSFWIIVTSGSVIIPGELQ